MSKDSLSPEHYKFMSALLMRTTGLDLGDKKEYLLESRLSETWKALGLSSLRDLVVHLQEKRPADLEKKIGDLMTTNESLFFRDGSPFETFQKNLLPAFYKEKAAQKTLRIWSAACSMGQEPYSIAICLLESGLDWNGWKVEILATDLAGHILKRAQEGKYSAYEMARGMPPLLQEKYFLKDSSGFVVKPILQKNIRFLEMNLASVSSSIGPFDFIFLRNVLIYFDDALKTKVLQSARKLIEPKGTLFLGSTESILWLSVGFSRLDGVPSSIYKPI